MKTAETLSYTNATALFPFLLVGVPPLLILYIYYAIVHGDGSVAILLLMWAKDLFITTTASVAAPYLFGSRVAWKVLGCYAASELLLMRVLPGQMQTGPPSPTGHFPVYQANGLLTYLGVIDPGLVYDHWERSSELSISLQSSCAGCCTLKASTYRQTPMQVCQVI